MSLFLPPWRSRMIHSLTTSDGTDVNLVWNLGVVDSGQKKFDFFQANFRKISIFSGNFTKNVDFPGKNLPFTATSWQIILFLFKSQHFQTYFLYMIRYRLIIFHDPSTTPHDPLRPQRPTCLKSGGRDPTLLPRVDAPVWWQLDVDRNYF